MVIHPEEFNLEVREAPRGGRGRVEVYHILEPEACFDRSRLWARLVLPPGSMMGYHVHEGEMEVFHILEGVASVNDNGVIHELHPGDVLYTGDGDEHSIESVGDSDLVYLAIIIRR